jgi:hypothetical protein
MAITRRRPPADLAAQSFDRPLQGEPFGGNASGTRMMCLIEELTGNTESEADRRRLTSDADAGGHLMARKTQAVQ